MEVILRVPVLPLMPLPILDRPSDLQPMVTVSM